MIKERIFNCKLYSLLLICLPVFSIGQTSDPYPYSSDIVKFDPITLRTDKALPFDKPFVLVIENISTDNILKVYLYRTKYIAGNRILFPDTRTQSNADYVFGKQEIIIEKNKLTLLVPPLKPGKDFDILIEKKLSGRNIQKAQALNKIIVDNNIHPVGGVITWPVSGINAFRVLRDSANNSQFSPPRDVFTVSDPDTYYNTVFILFKANYGDLINVAKYKIPGAGLPYLTPSEIKFITDKTQNNSRTFYDSHLLEQINKENTFQDILLGLRACGYAHGSDANGMDEFDKRISNINASVVFFDSLYQSMNELAATDAPSVSVRDNVMVILEALQANKNVLTSNLKAITDVLNGYNEAVWLIGTTQSKDLQTKSSSIFTLDAGMANMWARDLDNKVVYIPKLFWSLNIYFRGIDKNVKSRYIPKKKKPGLVGTDYVDYDILTHKTILNQLCLNVGFTFGSLDKQNFDNFFAGSSMLIGPSYRLTRSLRLSGGVVFLKRTQLNPLLSAKKITEGGYLSVSLDFDILSSLKNVSSLFFK